VDAFAFLILLNDQGSNEVKSMPIESLPILLEKMVHGKMGAWYEQLYPSDEIFKDNKKNSKLGVENVTSHLFAKYLKDGNSHPAKDYPDLFSKEFPDGALSYEWSLGLGGGTGLVVVLNDLKVQRARSEDGKRIGGRLRVWIDCFFIDQLSKKIQVELAISQEYYILCGLHIIAGSKSFLNRGWCLWELGLRAHSGKKSLVIGKLPEKVKNLVAYLNT
jgi:hypothetical protein